MCGAHASAKVNGDVQVFLAWVVHHPCDSMDRESQIQSAVRVDPNRHACGLQAPGLGVATTTANVLTVAAWRAACENKPLKTAPTWRQREREQRENVSCTCTHTYMAMRTHLSGDEAKEGRAEERMVRGEVE